jgi:hypothetical protein
VATIIEEEPETYKDFFVEDSLMSVVENIRFMKMMETPELLIISKVYSVKIQVFEYINERLRSTIFDNGIMAKATQIAKNPTEYQVSLREPNIRMVNYNEHFDYLIPFEKNFIPMKDAHFLLHELREIQKNIDSTQLLIETEENESRRGIFQERMKELNQSKENLQKTIANTVLVRSIIIIFF